MFLQGWTNFHFHLWHMQLLCLTICMKTRTPSLVHSIVALVIPKCTTSNKTPIIWHGTWFELMKLITNANVWNPNLDIHKLKEVVIIIDPSRIGTTHFSMVFTIVIGMPSSIKCFWFGITTWRFYCKIKCWN
jgi:hypothetical protein